MLANPLFLAKWNVHVFGADYSTEDSSQGIRCWKKLSPSEQMQIFACGKLLELLGVFLQCKGVLEKEQITQTILDVQFSKVRRILADL